MTTSREQKFQNSKTKIADLLLEDKRRREKMTPASKRRFVEKIIYEIISNMEIKNNICPRINDKNNIYYLKKQSERREVIPNMDKIPFAYYEYYSNKK